MLRWRCWVEVQPFQFLVVFFFCQVCLDVCLPAGLDACLLACWLRCLPAGLLASMPGIDAVIFFFCAVPLCLC
ncbi:hypothetical protein [Thiolapillus sp.]|uniref:hypothetical protein n=1 Tax=Thiolapillus sp. TaxID=2017437 RepID=UPI003AF9E2C7